jgi:signal transduction histidine kinase
VFYKTSVREIGRQVPPAAFFSDGEGGTVGGGGNFVTFFQNRVSEGRHALLMRLIFLNILALIIGAAISYWLARRALKPIEDAMDAQTRFSSDASHELRTPLTALRTRNEVTLRKRQLDTAEAKKVIRSNLDEIIKLENLTDGLLKLSRKNGRDIVKQPVLLQEIANEAMNRVIESAQAKSIKIDEEVPPVRVMADNQGLTQAVVILLDNAIKYSPDNSSIVIGGHRAAKYGVIRVTDKGPGIRATDLPHIFERFYRADSSRTKDGENGYGLGLAIAQKIVEQHGGEIQVQSEQGEGSTFSIRIPLADPPQ